MHWIDECGHDRPRDRFLGTIEAGGDTYDVHVYQDNALSAPVPDMHVCLRYGNECSQYVSPGNATEFVRVWSERKAPEEYTAALPLIRAWLEGKA